MPFLCFSTYLRLDSDLSHSRTKPQTSAVNKGMSLGQSHKVCALCLVATPQRPCPAITKVHIKHRRKDKFVYCHNSMVRSPIQARLLRRLWETGRCLPGQCLHCAHLKDFKMQAFLSCVPCVTGIVGVLLCPYWVWGALPAYTFSAERLWAPSHLSEKTRALWTLQITARASLLKSYCFWSHFRWNFCNLWLKLILFLPYLLLSWRLHRH